MVKNSAFAPNRARGCSQRAIPRFQRRFGWLFPFFTTHTDTDNFIIELSII
jgi:hypothetical protein